MCVSVCVPWGPHCVCWVRGGQGFNKGTGLVQGCQSDCLGDVQPDGDQMRATGLDVFLLDQRRVGAPIMFHSSSSLSPVSL